MDAGVARRTLEYLRVMEELLDLRIGLLLQRSELRHLIRRLLKRNTWPIRDELRDPVGLAERQVEHARHIPYDRLRAHRSKRDDLAYVVAAVLLDQDRKSTRLNSSHVAISYAVFCLQKKTAQTS